MTILVLLTLLGFTTQQKQCEPLTKEEALEQADFVFQGVAGGTYQIESKKLVSVGILELFKSERQIVFESMQIEINCSKDCSFCPETGDKYLIYGKSSDFKNGFFISEILRMKKTGDKLKDLDFLSRIDCKVLKPDTRGACPRHLAPVCGCNGITYPNACTAGQAGITRWRDGECGNN